MLKPVDPYGVAKVAAEDVLKILSKTHNIEYNIAITSLVPSKDTLILIEMLYLL